MTDATGHQLIIHATDSQIAQIRDLLIKLGEPLNGGDPSQSNSGGHVRTIQMSEAAAEAALQRVRQAWPLPNEIRILGPLGGNGSAPATGGGAESAPAMPDARPSTIPNRTLPRRDDRPADPPRSPAERLQRTPNAEPAAKVTSIGQERRDKIFGARILCVADPAPAKTPAEGKRPAPIVVIPGPNGLMVSCEDLDALDEFEKLLAAAADQGNGPLAVFYLKYAKAEDVQKELQKLLTGGGGADSEGFAEGAASLSRPASSPRPLATGTFTITPETRLNALLVLANRTDQATIERLLKTVFDIKESPEDIAVTPKARMIPVVHAKATEIADVLREVYADRLALNNFQQMQQNRGGGPGAFLPMLFGGGMPGMPGGGGRGGRGGDQGGQNTRDNVNRISISVNPRTNTLIVAAVDTLFEEVKDLVHQMDDEAAAENETVRVVPLHRTSALAVERALEAFAGEAVQAKNTDHDHPRQR